MSLVRGYSDKIRCDWKGCKVTFWAGSVYGAEMTGRTRTLAAYAGWDVRLGDLCPEHASRKSPDLETPDE